jgi:hypothetical protein
MDKVWATCTVVLMLKQGVGIYCHAVEGLSRFGSWTDNFMGLDIISRHNQWPEFWITRRRRKIIWIRRERRGDTENEQKENKD